MSRRPPRKNRRPGRGGSPRGHRGGPSETLEIEIESLGAQGDGVAQWAGRTLYVSGALPGETVRVRTGPKKGDGVACALVDVLAPVPERIQPLCPVYQRCGGCTLQHLDAQAYADLKRARIVEALAKRGIDAEAKVLAPLLIGPHTRRRVTFSAEHKGGISALGFNAAASHLLVDVDDCPVLSDDLNRTIAPLKALMARVLPDGGRARVAVTATDGALDVLIESDIEPNLAAREAIAAFSALDAGARVAWKQGRLDPEPIAQPRAPVVLLGGVEVELPPGAFLQASREGEQALGERVMSAVQGAKRVADLFCGLGTFTLPLAAAGLVVRAVDSFAPPVRALERAAGRAGLGGRVLGEVRDLEQNPLEARELDKFDAVVFDPPRAGAAAQVRHIAESTVSTVVAVSCNPATFARDARILLDGGYQLVDVLPVDQFTFSPHLELVARFAR